ncbi:MAG: Lrp/AsnC family transcriptional regulator [Candidatus Micrarchaeota archaeon]
MNEKTKNLEETIKIDEKDQAIIEELKKDSTLSEQKLAKRTGIPMTTIHNRIKKLEKNKIITGYTLNLDHQKLGKTLSAFVLVKAVQGADQKELLNQIIKLPQAYEAAMLTGEFDIIFKARLSSMEELNEVVVKGLRKQKNVGETRTMMCYELIEK